MIDPIYTTEMYCTAKNRSSFEHLNYSFGFQSNFSHSKNGDCDYYRIENYGTSSPKAYLPHLPSPNIALMSLILVVGTCGMALALKKLRRSVFFGAYVRRTFSDVGMLISIILMVTVDYLIETRTGLKTQVKLT